MLRLLAGPAKASRGVLVCVPYAAGGAVDFHALADAMTRREPDLAIYGIQAPGHDLDGRREPLLEVDELAELVVEEVVKHSEGPVTIWGHRAGTAVALEVARRMEGTGRPVRQVPLGGWVLPGARELSHELAVVAATPDEVLGADLVARGCFDDLTADEVVAIGRVYRHDTRGESVSAERRQGLGWPPSDVPGDRGGVDDRPQAPDYAYGRRYRDWRRFAARVDSPRSTAAVNTFRGLAGRHCGHSGTESVRMSVLDESEVAGHGPYRRR